MLHLILINQEPLRRSAAAECAEAMAQLEEARAEWHRFEREDKPAFARWRAREFGALLSKAREVEVQIRDYQTLVHEVEMEMRRGFQDGHSAYQKVMFRRKNPGATAEAEPEPAERDAGAARPLSEFEQEALFQDWVHKSLGTNPDKMDDEAYETSFAAFKTHMFRAPREEARPQNSSRARGPERVIEDEEEDDDENEATATDVRVKELYRRLVRRLHPDLRADGNTSVSALWHEVQEAYLAGDVARMEILLALSDLAANPMNDATSLGQMRALLAELERALDALLDSLREAEGEDAWNFARAGAVGDLRLRVGRQLKSDLAARSLRLDLLARTVAAWAQGPIANRHVTIPRSAQFAR